MQCVEFEDRLNRLLDHRLAPESDAQLAHHARQCDECAGLLGAQQRLLAGMRAARIAAPVDLADRVIARRHVERQGHRSRWRTLGWAAILATAASVGWIALMALKAREAGQEMAAERPAPAATHAKRGPSNMTAALAATSVGPARPKQDSEEKFDEYRRAFESLATRIGDTTELDEMSESLSPSIRPIQSSFGLAIDALWRTLPRGKEAPPMKPDAGAMFLHDLPVIG
jgi:hypothetical protein